MEEQEGLTSHHQRPSLSCWLGSTARVHGSHPMDTYPISCSLLIGTFCTGTLLFPVVFCPASCPPHVMVVLTLSMPDTYTFCWVSKRVLRAIQWDCAVTSCHAPKQTGDLIRGFVTTRLHDICRTQTSAAGGPQQSCEGVVTKPLS